MTKMSINQLTQITGHLKGEGMSAARDKAAAISRLLSVAQSLGIADKDAKTLLDAESAVDGCKLADKLKRMAIPPAPEKEEEPMNTTAAEKPVEEAKKRGRAASNAGRTLVAKVETNPRREGTHGHKSFSIILAAGKKGIKHEDYIAAGGRNNDLAWDIEHDSVSIS